MSLTAEYLAAEKKMHFLIVLVPSSKYNLSVGDCPVQFMSYTGKRTEKSHIKMVPGYADNGVTTQLIYQCNIFKVVGWCDCAITAHSLYIFLLLFCCRICSNRFCKFLACIWCRSKFNFSPQMGDKFRVQAWPLE